MKRVLALLLFCLPAFAASLTLQEEAKEFIRLVEACQAGELEVVRECLDLGVGPNREDGDNLTPLCHAAAYGRLEVTQLLLDRGASPKYLFGEKCSPLSYAIEGGNLDVVRCLLETGMLRGKDSDKLAVSGFVGSVMANNAEMLDLLIQYGAEPMLPMLRTPNGQYDGYHILTLAAKRDAENIVRYLLGAGVSPETRDSKGRTALACAPPYGVEIVKLLLKAGADPNVNSGRGFYEQGLPYMEYNPLLNAVLAHNLEAVSLLLKAGADPAEPDNLPLIMADMNGNGDIADLLLAAGAPAVPPYAYLDLITDLAFRPVENLPSASTGRPRHFRFAPQPIPEAPSADTPPPSPVKLGILVRDRSLLDLETLLTAKLSQLPKLTMVERSSLELVSRELGINDGFSGNPAQLLRAGEFLGADLLVILDREEKDIYLSLVNAETGLVLAENSYLASEAHETICQDFLARVTANRWKRNLYPDQLTLVSIPSLVSEQTDLFSLRTAAWVKRGLEQELARQPAVFLLERELLGSLAKEKSLNDSQRAFFNSGWILDGSVSVTSTENPELTLRLRAQGPGDATTIELTRSVTLEDPSQLLPGIVEAFLTKIGSAPDRVLTRGPREEMDAYQRNADQAAEMNEWKTAHSNAAVAWALGDRRKNTKDLLVRSAVHAIRESDLAITREINSLPESVRRLAAYRSPLLIRNDHPSILRRTELFEMVHRILDVYDTVLRTPGDVSKYDFALLAFIPVAMRAVVKPLEYSPSLSDQEKYGQELSALRNRILGIFDLALEVAETKAMPTIYDSTLAAKLEHLPLLISSPSEFHQQVKQIFLEAATLTQEPHSPHLVYQTAHIQGTRQAKTSKTWAESKPFRRNAKKIRTTWADAQWYRMNEWMTDSGDPFAKVIGLDIRKHLTNNPGKQLRIQKELVSAVQSAIRSDPTYRNRSVRHSDLKIPERFWVTWYGDWSLNYRGGGWYPDLFSSPNSIFLDERRLGAVYGKWSIPDTRSSTPFSSIENGITRPSYHLRQIRNQWADFLGDYMERGTNSVYGSGFNLAHIDSPAVLTRLLSKLELANTRSPSPPEVTAKHAEEISERIAEMLELTRDRLAELSGWNAPWFTLNLKNFHPAQQRGNYFPLSRTPDGFAALARNQLILVDAAGQVTHRIPFPEEYKPVEFQTMHTTFEDSMDATRIAVYLYRWRSKSDQKIGIYTFDTKKWSLLSIPELPEPLRVESVSNRLDTLLLLKDHVVYSTIRNSIENPAANTFQTVKDPLRSIGLSAIHLPDGTHIPLANNRWIPARSPLDSIMGNSYRPFRLGDNRIGLRGWIYSFDTQSWSEGDTPAYDWEPWSIRNPLDTGFGLEINGYNFGMTVSNPSTAEFSVTISRKSPSTKRWWVREGTGEFTYTNWSPLHGNDPDVESKDANGVYQPLFRILSFSLGLLAYNDQGFCFVPKSELVPLLQPVIRSLKDTPTEPE